jgi:galactokinase
MNGKALLDSLDSPQGIALFESLYGSGGIKEAQRRYRSLIEGIAGMIEETTGDLRLFTAPGRTELGGNHTDHNRGKVLAASVQLDIAAVVAPRQDKTLWFRSAGYPDVQIDLSDLSPRQEEKGTAKALVRGVAAAFAHRGISVGGFTANADSTVSPGSGLSSSAAVEVLLGKIFDTLYGGGKLSALEIAQMGQKAENDYFGKPSGLMDQIACASGGAVVIDFGDAAHPLVKQINFDLESLGFALCVVNTRGSHADLTGDYASIPEEMKGVARFFGKSVLRDVGYERVLSLIGELRKVLGDRAILRAIHFFNENQRVDAMLEALKEMDSNGAVKQSALEVYLALVNQSGDSSWELLQNIYSPANPQEQSISLALSLTRTFFQEALGPSKECRPACRVHGGGFAGTIQAYIPLDCLDAYKAKMEAVFGSGAVTVLRIRPVGPVELSL